MKVKVWNKNVHPLEEMFKGDKIVIPANSWIAMEHDDAVMYKGQFKSPMIDHDGNDKPEGFKMVVIEPMDSTTTLAKIAQSDIQVADELVCQACRYKAATKDDLGEHLKEMHADQAFSDPAIEQEINLKKTGGSKHGKSETGLRA